MTTLDAVLVAAFGLCAAVVAFAYIGYPILVWLLSRCFGRDPAPPAVESADLPTVSLLIAAHNEEEEIEERIRNALALRYPPDKFEIVIASDGSTDATDEIVRRYADRGVRLLAFPVNRGKAAVLNDSVPRLRGELVVLSDANTRMHPDAVRSLATWFADPAVGVVCGKLILTDPTAGRNADGLYWKYETFLKACESRLGALLGCNGAIYAIRRTVFPNVRAGTIIDDFVIPLEARRHTGCRVQFDSEAVAWEETPPDLSSEFRRRSRIGAGGFQTIARLWPLLSPAHGWVSLTFLGHKVLRWLSPFCLLGLLVLNVLLLRVPGFEYLLVGQVAFYAAALAAAFLPARPRALRPLRLTTMFATMNLALLVGFFRWATGVQRGTWERTARGPTRSGADVATP
jgi:cellulose synthase/poly-beta-1,6-N-acetylglucosamine synthase-like glycosyltransferase